MDNKVGINLIWGRDEDGLAGHVAELEIRVIEGCKVGPGLELLRGGALDMDLWGVLAETRRRRRTYLDIEHGLMWEGAHWGIAEEDRIYKTGGNPHSVVMAMSGKHVMTVIHSPSVIVSHCTHWIT